MLLPRDGWTCSSNSRSSLNIRSGICRSISYTERRWLPMLSCRIRVSVTEPVFRFVGGPFILSTMYDSSGARLLGFSQVGNAMAWVQLRRLCNAGTARWFRIVLWPFRNSLHLAEAHCPRLEDLWSRRSSCYGARNQLASAARARLSRWIGVRRSCRRTQSSAHKPSTTEGGVTEIRDANGLRPSSSGLRAHVGFNS
jgi:hypothetical protein